MTNERKEILDRIFGPLGIKETSAGVWIAQSTMTVDNQSYELAEHFLADEAKLANYSASQRAAITMTLAQTIQRAIEDWFTGNEWN